MSDWIEITPEGGLHQSARARFREAWPLVRVWTARELRARYRQSWLRSGWSVIQPLALFLTYGWVLVSVFNVDETTVPYLTFAWAGLVPFTFMSMALSLGVGSIVSSAHIVSKVYFPREVLPLSVVGAAVVDLAVTTLILVVVAWVQVGPPTIHILGLVLVDAVLLLWTSAIVVLVSVAGAFRRDVIHAMPLVLRVLFIVSPVMYASSLLSDKAPALVYLNPLAVVIDGTRDSVAFDRWPNWGLLAAHAVSATVLLIVALDVVRRAERTIADRI